MRCVADHGGVDVLVSRRVLENRAGVQPRLVREGRRPDVGRRPGRDPVQNVVQHPTGAGQSRKLAARDADVIGAGVGFLQQQCRDQRGQIGVTTALAQPVQRALYLSSSSVHRGQRPGHCVAGVVMGVDCQAISGECLTR